MSGAGLQGAGAAAATPTAGADARPPIALAARVIEVSTRGVVVAAGRARWLLALPQPGPALQAGSTLRLLLPGPAGAPAAQARLAAIDGRTLVPQLPVELRAAPRRADAPAPSPSRPGEAGAPPSPQVPARPALGVFAGRPELPRPDGQLAARLLQLLGLLEAGADVPPRRAASAPDPGSALARALAELVRHSQEPLPGGWRLQILPVGDGQAVQEVRLYVRGDEQHQPGRNQPDDVAPGDEDPPRRAVFEVEFSRLDRCQIDALCRASRFDLVLRTAAPLDPALRHEIEAIFDSAREGGGLAGEIGFRSGDLPGLPAPRGPGVSGITV